MPAAAGPAAPEAHPPPPAPADRSTRQTRASSRSRPGGRSGPSVERRRAAPTPSSQRAVLPIPAGPSICSACEPSAQRCKNRSSSASSASRPTSSWSTIPSGPCGCPRLLYRGGCRPGNRAAGGDSPASRYDSPQAEVQSLGVPARVERLQRERGRQPHLVGLDLGVPARVERADRPRLGELRQRSLVRGRLGVPAGVERIQRLCGVRARGVGCERTARSPGRRESLLRAPSRRRRRSMRVWSWSSSCPPPWPLLAPPVSCVVRPYGAAPRVEIPETHTS